MVKVLDAVDDIPCDDDIIEDEVIDPAVLHPAEDLRLPEDAAGRDGHVPEHDSLQVPGSLLALAGSALTQPPSPFPEIFSKTLYRM